MAGRAGPEVGREVTVRGGLAGKRRAIVAGARGAFARSGFVRASIEVIAAEAGVSTRTIYNHFGSKAGLVETVVAESTAEVAQAQVVLIDEFLGEVVDVEAALVGLGRALARPMAGFVEHFALVRQLDAEADHLPEGVVEAWREAGPVRVNGVLAGHLQRMADRGQLRVTDPHWAAKHYMLLVHGAFPFRHGLGTASEAEIHEIVTAGVHAFLHGYLP